MPKQNAQPFLLAMFTLLISFSSRAQPAAQFTATPQSGCAPLLVSFQDQSTGNPTQWRWDLGNSTISFLRNPVATYFNPGTYTVKLVVQNASGIDSIIKTQFVTVQAQPAVNFSTNNPSGCYPLPVQFTNASTAGAGTITSYFWDFGDGVTSTLANPSHIYNASGSYHVSLRISNSAGCVKTLTRTNYIIIAAGVKAEFTNSVAQGCMAPETIQFTNTSTGTGAVSYQWNFGDGSSSTAINPSHIYASAGIYTVQLIAISAQGCRDTSIHLNAVNIGTLLPGFIAPGTLCAGDSALFMNTSLPAPDSVKWYFGDGSLSDILNPMKVFAGAGTYAVKLVSYVGACKDSIIKNVTVVAKPTAAFTGAPLVSCAAPLPVNFSNASIGASTYFWDFGDGSSSSLANPLHTYTQPGNYTVKLIATNSSGCSDSLSKAAYVLIQLPQAAINNLPQEGCAPFSWTFTATINSPDPVTNYLWNFGDGTTSSLANPTHIFSAGLYDISLVITTVGGCKDTVVVAGGIRATTKPTAGFNASPRDVCAFTTVNFFDASSTNVNNWLWSFGDGGFSTEQNPTHMFEDTGFFDIQLVVGNFGCYDTLKMTNYIHVNPPIARFIVLLNCETPFVRVFSDSAIGANEWRWNFGDGNTSTTQSPTHTYSSVGNYLVTQTVRNLTTGCEHSKTATVVIADEAAVFSASQREICRRQTTSFTASQNHPGGIQEYLWDFGDGNIGTGNPVSHSYNNSGNYSIKLLITDAAGCKDSSIQSNYIRVNGPVANFGAALPGSCLLTSVQFNDSSTTDGQHAITQWTWSYGNGITEVLNAGPFSHSYASAGSYSVSLIVQDAKGCTDSISKPNLLVISTPMAEFTASDTVTCPLKPVQFTNSSTGPGLAYSWDFGDGQTSSARAPNHSYQQDGLYTVRLSITDAYGCISQKLRPAYIRVVTPRANFTMSDSASTCPPLIVQFTNTSSNQSTYNWDFGDGTFSTAASPSHFYNVAGTYFAKLSITGAGGCTSMLSKKIVIRGPKGSFSYQNLQGCKPLTVRFRATTQDRTSFVWDFNDGTTVVTNDSIISHTYTAPGIYVPKMILKDAAGCTVPITGSDTVVVSGVTAAFSADTLLRCSQGNVQFTNSTVSNDLITGYLWNFGDGTTSTDTSPSHFYAGEGYFTASLSVITAMGCKDSLRATLPVRVVKTPSIGITQSANGCVPVNFNLAGNLLNNDTSAIVWSWDFSDGRTANGKALNPMLFATAGTFNSRLVATNRSGCRDTANTQLEAFALPVVDAGQDKTICQGRGQALTAMGAASYTWSPATGLSCTTCPSPTATPATATLYRVTGKSFEGCVANDSILVSVKYPFQMQHSNGDTLCLGESVELSGSGAASYSWSPSAGLSSNDKAKVTARPNASTTYMLVGTDDIGCFKDTAYVPIKVYPIPTVAAGADLTINVGQTKTLTPIVSADVTDVRWYPTGSIFRTIYPSIDIKPKQTTQYRVEVSNAGGCTASDLLDVVVLCNGANVFIPNTFSPNGDGANEHFYPRGTGLFRIKTARIFNRWGELVFEKYNMNANEAGGGWDGTYKGQKLASDVFVYMFEIICDNDAVLLYKGDIALIR